MSSWLIVDDGVMGGLSQGSLKLNQNGHAVFAGDVSLENNGGFSSMRYTFDEINVDGYTTCKLRLRGDGKRYQFRVKSDSYDRHSYIAEFETSGEWQTVEIPLISMYPSFRGRKLQTPDYPGEAMEEIAILIGNKKEESFQLTIDWIGLGR